LPSTALAISTTNTSAAVDPSNSMAIPGAWMSQQLPPLNKFSGEGDDSGGETIEEWLEQFELVATVARWDQPAKLANLVTRLRGPAFVFFCSCPAQQHGNYTVLVLELRRRFTPDAHSSCTDKSFP
jgi:hypothetical protein